MVGNVLKEREDYHRIYVDEEPSKKLKKDRKKWILRVLPFWVLTIAMLIWVLSSSILENDSINILLMGIMMVLASIPVTVMIRV